MCSIKKNTKTFVFSLLLWGEKRKEDDISSKWASKAKCHLDFDFCERAMWFSVIVVKF